MSRQHKRQHTPPRYKAQPPHTPPTDTATVPGVNHLGTEKVVLADYMMWYDPSSFNGNITWDVLSSGAYNSDDPATLQRHVNLAQQACLDGLAPHWYGPNDEQLQSITRCFGGNRPAPCPRHPNEHPSWRHRAGCS